MNFRFHVIDMSRHIIHIFTCYPIYKSLHNVIRTHSFSLLLFLKINSSCLRIYSPRKRFEKDFSLNAIFVIFCLLLISIQQSRQCFRFLAIRTSAGASSRLISKGILLIFIRFSYKCFIQELIMFIIIQIMGRKSIIQIKATYFFG